MFYTPVENLAVILTFLSGVVRVEPLPPPKSLSQSKKMSQSNQFQRLGLIGLGAMGLPMMSHLARKLPEDSRIWVYDVVEQAVDDACAEFPNRVLKGRSAKDVAQQAVC